MMNKNVFVKPNGQSRACASYAMAKKRLLKTNLFLSILFLLAASAAGAQEPPVTEAEIERQEQQRARETTEQRVEQAVEGELQELLERIPDCASTNGYPERSSSTDIFSNPFRCTNPKWSVGVCPASSRSRRSNATSCGG